MAGSISLHQRFSHRHRERKYIRRTPPWGWEKYKGKVLPFGKMSGNIKKVRRSEKESSEEGL